MAGMIICIDGLDGAGKNTQSLLLQKKLKKMGYSVSLHSYPDYESRYGKIIKEHLTKKITLNVYEFFLMFVADMIKDKVTVDDEVKKGNIVIMDRYFTATVAYQSAGGFDFEKAKAIENIVGLTPPSIVFYLHVPVEVSQERKIKQKSLEGGADRHEADRAYLGRVMRMYDKLYEEKYSGAKWVKIDATKGIEQVKDAIMSAFLEKIGKQSKQL